MVRETLRPPTPLLMPPLCGVFAIFGDKPSPMRLRLALLFLLFSLVLTAQEEGEQRPDLTDWTVNPILAFQGWGTYTFGGEERMGNTFEPVDDRLNFMVRRFRWGATAGVGDRLFIKFLGALDFVGSDQRAGTVGGVNNGGFPAAQIWDLYVRYRVVPKSEVLYVVGGWLRPPLGRESMSGALGVASFEKGWNQWYIRQHLVGTGPGGTAGVYLGGMRSLNEGLHVDYRAGVFNPEGGGLSGGRTFSPLFVSRLNLMFGDPEKQSWTYGLAAANTFGRRQGASLAVVYSTEGPTERVARGVRHLGLDGVVSLGQFHLEGEWHGMLRRATQGEQRFRTFMLRTGVNLPLATGGATPARYLEPTVMVYGFRGGTTNAAYDVAVATAYFAGDETVYDVGLNYHLVPGKIRLGLHYVGRSGELGEIAPGPSLAWHHFQAGVGPIVRGDYVGAELILSL